ncbi:MAG: hypothetical protein IPJ37_11060 [Bacteroidales bacterium]|nr:hypothetical protein [Bacteroidales bacterium]
MIYAGYTNGGYQFIEPIYDLRWNLLKLAFAKNFCAICTNSGSLTVPDFWVEEKSSLTKK